MKNSRETLYSKGDNRRPEDTKKFSDGYDRIFGNPKPSRKERNDVRARKRGPATND